MAPKRHHDADAVCDAIHFYDVDIPVIRRWWTDNGGEFVSASKRLRNQRPLAHYTSIPRVALSNGKIERFVRTVCDGTRCILVHSKFPQAWFIVDRMVSRRGSAGMGRTPSSRCTRLVLWSW